MLAIDDSPKPPPHRVTLSLPVLARDGLERILVAMGEGKRAALERLLSGDESIPATRLRTSAGRCRWPRFRGSLDRHPGSGW